MIIGRQMNLKIRSYRSFIILIAIITLAGCKGDNLDDCFSNTGDVVVESRSAVYFETVNLYDNINLVIEPGTDYSIRIEGGENLLSAITTDVNDSVLIIHNTMKCNWIRDYENEITVYITSPGLKSIRYESSGDVRTKEILTLEELEINVWGGSGSIIMDVDCIKLNLGLHYGTVDFNISGSAVTTTIYANSYGPFYCEQLNSNIVFIRNSGTNDCYIHANHILGAEITSVGNIYYTGNPYSLSCNATGAGKLIKLE